MINHTPGPWNREALHRLLRFYKKTRARLKAVNAELLQELEDRYQQTKCGCGHPACKRCQDDRITEAVLAKARGETGCTT